MSSKGNQPSYASIVRDGNDDDHAGEGSSSPLLSSRKGKELNWHDRIRRAQNFARRNLYHILVLFTIITLLVVLTVYTLLPDSSVIPTKEAYPQTIKAGVSELTMETGRIKCETIQTRKREKNLPDQERKNPRAESAQKPILLKNAIVWDGQGNVLNNVDIYIEDGIIQKVEKDVQLSKDQTNVKVIDVAGHVVGPGLVDMHRYISPYKEYIPF